MPANRRLPLLAVLLLTACWGGPPEPAAPAQGIAPPVAARRPIELTTHGDTRVDEYFWLRDDERADPEVLTYLERENAYAEASLSHLADLREALYRELKSRIPDEDVGVPYVDGDWEYQVRYAAGAEHPVYLRRPVSGGGEFRVILDAEAEARGHDYYELGDMAVSEDGRLLAYAEDAVGREEYVIRIKDLETGHLLPDSVAMTSGEVAWANDNRSLFYVRLEEGTLIPRQVWRRRIGSGTGRDVLVYEEPDPTFGLALEKSRDARWIAIHASSTLTDEFMLIDADAPEAPWTTVLPRRPGHEHLVEALGDEAWILTNDHAPNFRLVRAPLAESADPASWVEVVPHREDVLIEDFLVFRDHVVLNERSDANLGLRILDRVTGASRHLPAKDPAFVMSIDVNPEADTTVLRYTYESMVTPETIVDLDMATGRETVRKVEPVPGYNPSGYVTLRTHVDARDGTPVPVTLLFREGIEPDGSHPLFQAGYGSYGISYDTDFRSRRLSLVDRGFVFAIAHVRGGQECGRRWYDAGRLLQKKNSFTDFMDVTEGLVRDGWGHPDRVVAMGRSAGGLLMGAVANMRPDLYRVIVAGVPFVDVVTTMLDDSIPLTTFEFDEWGDPSDPEAYDYMLSYSPYDQVRAQAYPALYVSAGLYDPRVQYWEPAKWVARLRARKTDDRPLLLRTNMEAGHFSASGRYEILREIATEYAFVLDQMGLAGRAGPPR